jgi:hypothetical protein
LAAISRQLGIQIANKINVRAGAELPASQPGDGVGRWPNGEALIGDSRRTSTCVTLRLTPPGNPPTACSPYSECNTHHSDSVFRVSHCIRGTAECICDSDSNPKPLILAFVSACSLRFYFCWTTFSSISLVSAGMGFTVFIWGYARDKATPSSELDFACLWTE